LGGFGFAAAALQLADRDKWIGWDKEQQQAHLHRVIGMSRFLIRPSVNCHNLASKVLSMSVASEFRKHLGLSPNAGLGALDMTDGLDAEHWAKHEFGGAPLGDKCPIYWPHTASESRNV
jgi:hypothetical protein